MSLLALVAFVFPACATLAPTIGPVVPEHATSCRKHCEDLGMRLSGMVIMSNRAGCVCSVLSDQERPATASVAAAAGAVLAAEEDEARARNQQLNSSPGR
jgi:hypothetical protein